MYAEHVREDGCRPSAVSRGVACVPAGLRARLCTSRCPSPMPCLPLLIPAADSCLCCARPRQVGRAGRDGGEARCVALLDDADFVRLRSLAFSGVLDLAAVRGFLEAVFSPVAEGEQRRRQGGKKAAAAAAKKAAVAKKGAAAAAACSAGKGRGRKRKAAMDAGSEEEEGEEEEDGEKAAAEAGADADAEAEALPGSSDATEEPPGEGEESGQQVAAASVWRAGHEAPGC